MTIVILTGMPGAGKSTVSRLLAARRSRAARISADDLHSMIVSGAVWPLGLPADEADRQVDLVYRNLSALAENFADADFNVVIDCVIPDGAHLQRLLELMSPRSPELVVLAPGAVTCRERNAAREASEKFDFDGYEQLDESMRAGFGGRGRWLDTSNLSKDETAELIEQYLSPDGAPSP
ncbi:AAA family ATPase [Curtobacterium sp. VKM Ac-2922]|uniref:AAA family ATPase n=1 Tax=Curtobacterium sp. VKM Ac-2922 TaxID=2929475 RepID=UPI001FB2E020|nr:AAA family ATPase [Curtobacterium sp. VKM Ac-2922]MCJ1712901.1 ATP-binding protein [Curtobacterium sp. VKM Ac-2922]